MQTQLTDTRRAHQGELERVSQQIANVTRERDELRQVKSDYDILEQLIDENPDLAEQLFERAGNLRPRGGQTPGAAPAGQPQNPELVQEVRRLRSMMEAQTTTRAEAEKSERLDMTDRQLGDSLKTLLTDHGLDESWLPSAREYVLAVARRIPTLEMDEVPYVFAEWAKPLQERLNNQLNTWRNGKMGDLKELPPSPTGGQLVTASGNKGALDRNTKAILEERLKNALGWKND